VNYNTNDNYTWIFLARLEHMHPKKEHNYGINETKFEMK
jgi:hypothetical protein